MPRPRNVGSIVSKSAQPRAADCLRHPVILVLLFLWILNDHVLKAMFGNMLTGKISDFSGVAILPLALVGAYECACAALSKSPRFRHEVLVTSLLMTGVFMAGINLSASLAATFSFGLGVAQWPARAVWHLCTSGSLPQIVSVHHTMDPSDLYSLSALVVPFYLGIDRPDLLSLRTESRAGVINREKILQ